MELKEAIQISLTYLGDEDASVNNKTAQHPRLKLLVKCALLNGEYALARKYNDQIGQTLFHKDWAERYGRMIDQPELISQDPDFARIPKDPLPNRFVE